MRFYHLIIVAIVGSLFASCNSENVSTPSEEIVKTPIVEKWYVGGTLHKGTIAQWKEATDRNKLATCGDWVAVGNNSVSDRTLLKMRAESLKRCVDQLADGQDEKSDDDAISEIAAICISTFGY